MILVKPSVEIIDIMGTGFENQNPLELIEIAGRTCYKSEEKMTDTSHKEFVKAILKRGHESVIEHSAMTVKFIVDRGVTHELVRHRLCAFSQESTRYCNYKGGVTFVIPPWVDDVESGEYPFHWKDGPLTSNNIGIGFAFVSNDSYHWFWSMVYAEDNYKKLLQWGWSPQQARSVLPNSLKTEIVVTANFREWRHILKLRTSKAAHPQMREVMLMLLERVKKIIPVIFDDILAES